MPQPAREQERQCTSRISPHERMEINLPVSDIDFMASFLRKLRLTLEMIKFEHSVFALPFALTGALLALREDGFRSRRPGVEAAVDRGGDGGARGPRPWRSIACWTPRSTPAIRARRCAICRRACCRERFAWGFVGVSVAGVPAGGAAHAESAVSAPGAGRAGDRAVLFVHQALHLVFAPGARDSRWASRRRPPGSRCAARSIRAFCGSPPR